MYCGIDLHAKSSCLAAPTNLSSQGSSSNRPSTGTGWSIAGHRAACERHSAYRDPKGITGGVLDVEKNADGTLAHIEAKKSSESRIPIGVREGVAIENACDCLFCEDDLGRIGRRARQHVRGKPESSPDHSQASHSSHTSAGIGELNPLSPSASRSRPCPGNR